VRRPRCAPPLARPLLPDAYDVSARVADQRDPEVALGVRLRHDLGAVGGCLLERSVEALDEDVRADAALASDCVVGAEVPDDVAGAVLERRVLAVSANLPAEDGLVEVG
jgi:hypothetical protein